MPQASWVRSNSCQTLTHTHTHIYIYNTKKNDFLIFDFTIENIKNIYIYIKYN